MVAQSIYGADTTTRTGPTVYGFSSTADRAIFDFSANPNPVVAIWDAAGRDKLDASGFSTDQLIDLHQGAFSSIGYLTHNVAVAYGAEIEDAAGGGGRDLLVGNGLGNALNGNAGADEIEGHGGDDLLRGGAGDDTVVGGAGEDVLFGDAGADTFVFSSGDGSDRIEDFAAGDDLVRVKGAAAIDDLAISDAASGASIAHAVGDQIVLTGNLGRLCGGKLVPLHTAPDPADPGGVDLTALYRGALAASQSTQVAGYAASQAVDGSVADGSFSHTYSGPGQWLEIDLGGAYDLTKIEVTNVVSPDPAADDRAKTVDVVVLDDARAEVARLDDWGATASGSEHLFALPEPAAGRYVRFEQTAPTYLHLQEVRVFGDAEPQAVPLAEQDATDRRVPEDTQPDMALLNGADPFDLF